MISEALVTIPEKFLRFTGTKHMYMYPLLTLPKSYLYMETNNEEMKQCNEVSVNNLSFTLVSLIDYDLYFSLVQFCLKSEIYKVKYIYYTILIF